MMNREKIEYYKKAYPVGTRIRLLHMDDPYSPIPDGTTGTVVYVDDMGTLHMKWDNGRSLGICPDVDSFEVIGKEAE
jgi:hypothetical protein